MKILILTEYFPDSENAEFTGGVENRSFNIVKQLARLGHDVKVICSRQPGQKRKFKIFDSEIYRVGPSIKYTNSGSIGKRLGFVRSAIKLGKTFDSDIVDAQSFLTYIPGYIIAKKIGAKKFATWHETWVGEWIKNKGFFTGVFGETWERIALRLNWDKVISVSRFTKNKISQKTDKSITVIPNGVDINQFSSIKGQKHKDFTFCYFGRINWQKNLGFLIKAVGKISKKHKIKCKIIGDGPALKSLKDLSHDLGIDQYIKFTGRIENYNEFMKEAKRCHAYVSPSMLEGFGITVLEACALGLPYVISDIEPFVEITNGGKGGYLFNKEKIDDLVNQMEKLIDKKSLNRKSLESQILLKKYNWQSIVHKLIKVYLS